MPYDARSVANDLIHRAEAVGRSLTPMQVQKVVYFCHGWFLGKYGEPLVEQDIIAWEYGPVVPRLYRSLRKYGAKPVSQPIRRVDEVDFDEREELIVSDVFLKYGKLRGSALSTLTHLPGSPWFNVYYDRRRGPNSVIPEPEIRDYFASFYGEESNG